MFLKFSSGAVVLNGYTTTSVVTNCFLSIS
jgi:hypothetical protein